MSYLASVPTGKHLPLFQILIKDHWLPLSGFKARSFLKLAVTSIGLDPKRYTFHSFRRSGASLAFNHDIDLARIKQHGSWKSDAIWTYLRNKPKEASTIPTTFAKIISTTYVWSLGLICLLYVGLKLYPTNVPLFQLRVYAHLVLFVNFFISCL